MHAHTYAMLMVAWLHVYRGNVRARARTYITFIHRYCRLPRTRSAEQILEARLPRCHCGKCWSLSTRRAQEVDADQRWCREKRKRFFGRIIAEKLRQGARLLPCFYENTKRRIIRVFFSSFKILGDCWNVNVQSFMVIPRVRLRYLGRQSFSENYRLILDCWDKFGLSRKINRIF